MNTAQPHRIDTFIPESELASFFSQEGKDFLDACRTTGRFPVPSDASHRQASCHTKASADTEIYYELYHACDAHAVLVLCHGFTETCTKYHEMIYYFLQHGFHVFTYDHRGHGRSFRETDNLCKVHADNFDTGYVHDLQLLCVEIVQKAFPELPLFLYGHSMGGCIAALSLEQYPDMFRRCVLSSPMLGIKTFPLFTPVAYAVAHFMKRIGLGHRYIIGQGDYHPDEPFEKSASASRARYECYQAIRRQTPEFQTNGGDYSWLCAALSASHHAVSAAETAKIKTPVLLFEAENDVYVPKKCIAKFLKKVPTARYQTYTGTKHEIYSSKDSVTRCYYEEIFRFFDAAD